MAKLLHGPRAVRLIWLHCMQILGELSPFQRERAALQMLQPGYVRKLLDLFRVRTLARTSAQHDAHRVF